ncbi:hypothetical protein IAT40_003573 [Kwoniella sp. CBS 6097]
MASRKCKTSGKRSELISETGQAPDLTEQRFRWQQMSSGVQEAATTHSEDDPAYIEAMDDAESRSGGKGASWRTLMEQKELWRKVLRKHQSSSRATSGASCPPDGSGAPSSGAVQLVSSGQYTPDGAEILIPSIDTSITVA